MTAKLCNACHTYPALEGKDKCESCHGILTHIARYEPTYNGWILQKSPEVET